MVIVTVGQNCSFSCFDDYSTHCEIVYKNYNNIIRVTGLKHQNYTIKACHGVRKLIMFFKELFCVLSLSEGHSCHGYSQTALL